MKKLLLSAVFYSIVLSAFGQSQTIRNFHNKYDGDRDVTFITLEGSLFKIAGFVAELADEDDEDLRDLAKLSDGIDRMKIMSIEDYEYVLDDDELDEFYDDIKDDGYDVLLTAREGRKIVRVMSQQSARTTLKDVAILIEEGRDFSIITIEGSIDLEDLDMFMDK